MAHDLRPPFPKRPQPSVCRGRLGRYEGVPVIRNDAWSRDVELQHPSPAVATSFRRSAAQLEQQLSEPTLNFVVAAYENVYALPSDDVEAIAVDLINAGLHHDPASGHALLKVARGTHRDPLQAVAAQALDTGSGSDQKMAVEILQDLATRAGFAEAGAILSLHRSGVDLGEDERDAGGTWRMLTGLPPWRGYAALTLL